MIDRYVETVLAGIFQVHEISLDAGHRQVFEAEILADPVVGVHEVFAGFEIGLAQRGAFFGRSDLLTPRGVAVELIVADDDKPETRNDKPTVDAAFTAHDDAGVRR